MAGHINQVREMSLPAIACPCRQDGVHYTFNLRPARVTELVRGLRPAFDLGRRDLLTFADFLDDLSTADEESGKQ